MKTSLIWQRSWCWGKAVDSSLSSPQPTLHSLACSLLVQFLDHLWREASWLLFAVRPTCFFVWTSALSHLPECNSSFLTSYHCLLHVILPPFFLLWFLLSSLILKYKIFCFLPRCLIFFCLFGICLLWVLSDKTSCINSSLWCTKSQCTCTTCCLCTWLFLLSPRMAQVIARVELLLLEKEEITQPVPTTVSYEKSLLFWSLLPWLPN